MKDLLESGVHFGHQTRRWDPKMKPYIYTERNGIHIIDLQKTVEFGEIAYNAVRDMSAEGGKILFIGTKKQAQESVKSEALRCSQFYVTHRWLGGMLTNFETIKKSILRLKRLEKMEVDGTFQALTKKEVLRLTKEKLKLERVLGGIKDMGSLPTMVFIVDPKKEHIALKEAQKLNIPVVAVVDTNCDPTTIEFPIPGNDDAIRAINLFVRTIANAVIEGENIAGKEMAEMVSKEESEEEAREINEEGEVISEDEDDDDETATEEIVEEPVAEAKSENEEETEEVKASDEDK